MSKENSINLFEFLDDVRVKTGSGEKNAKNKSGKSYGAIPKKQRDMQNRIMATSEKKQVMVKIIGKGGGGSKSKNSARRGMSSIKRLTNYLEKELDNDFESRDGYKLKGSNDVDDYIKKEWEQDFTKRANGSDILHMVVSNPAGSGRKETEDAARDFGREFFKNNDYVMVRHDDTNNPHVHFIIKIKGDDGKRLNLNKKDLQLARETFAFHSRENGIDVAASYRTWRGVQKKFIAKSNGEYVEKTAESYYKKKNSEYEIDNDNDWKENLERSKKKEAGIFKDVAIGFSKIQSKSAIELSRKLNKHSVNLYDDNKKEIDR